MRRDEKHCEIWKAKLEKNLNTISENKHINLSHLQYRLYYPGSSDRNQESRPKFRWRQDYIFRSQLQSPAMIHIGTKGQALFLSRRTWSDYDNKKSRLHMSHEISFRPENIKKSVAAVSQ